MKKARKKKRKSLLKEIKEFTLKQLKKYIEIIRKNEKDLSYIG